MKANKEFKQVRSEFGAHLRKVRESREMSAYALAKAAGVAESTISRLERGMFFPSVEQLIELLHVLDYELDFRPIETKPQAKTIPVVYPVVEEIIVSGR